MNNISQGWVKLHRQIQNNPLYFSEPFNRALAWVDMLLIANHTDNFFYKRGIRVDVKKGQIGYDLDSLAQRWKWSRGKVERFLKELENDNQIVRQKTNITTLISITNYELYQSDSKADSKPNSKANGHQIVKQTETNNNDKNYKNEKNEDNTDAVASSFSLNEVDLVYNAYPTVCPISFRRISKSSKDKEKIKKLLKTITYTDLLSTIKGYITNSELSSKDKDFKIGLKDLSTFLNNLPLLEDLRAQYLILSKGKIETKEEELARKQKEANRF